MKKFFISKKGMYNLRLRLNKMTEEMRECITQMGKSGNNDKDLIENPDFMNLRTKADYEFPQKIAHLQNIINNVVIIEDQAEIKDGKPVYVVPGCMVELHTEGASRIIHILGAEESEPALGIISYETPVGSALLDLEVGEEVDLPYKGKRVRYEITSIKVSPYLTMD